MPIWVSADRSRHRKGAGQATRCRCKRTDPPSDESALQSLALEIVGQLDGVASASIRADEAIGPGIYHPSIVAIAYTIRRCHFF
uniref:hypothetical protein n=1 Tax=Sphingomonas bacterium TaxID=1895847 RepID=UPI0026182EFC|nr:hypothetical protein [Sphingomonas bacterium]